MKLARIVPGVKIPTALMMAVVLGLALTGGVLAAKAAIPSAQIPNDGTIHACYMPHKNAGEKQGKLRLVSDGSKCKRNEVAISWSQAGGGGGGGGGVGPAGPVGPAGATGPAGPAGDATPASKVELRGPVQGITVGSSGASVRVTEIFFRVVLMAGEEPVDLTVGTANVKYEDPSQSIISTTLSRFQAEPVQGVSGSPADSDLFLEPGEIFEIRLLNFDNFLSPKLSPATTFSVDVISEHGSALVFHAATPDSFPEGTQVIILPVVTPP